MPTNSNFAATFFEYNLMKDAASNRTSDLLNKQAKAAENSIRERASVESKQTENKGLLESFINKPAEDQEESRVSRDPKKISTQEASKSKAPDQGGNLFKSSNYSNHLEIEKGQPIDRTTSRLVNEAYNPYKTESLLNSNLVSNYSKQGKEARNFQLTVSQKERTKLGFSSHMGRDEEEAPAIFEEDGRSKWDGSKLSRGPQKPNILIKTDKQTKPSVIIERDHDFETDPEITEEDIQRNKQTAEFTTKDFGLNSDHPNSQNSSPLADDIISKKKLVLNFERKPTFGVTNKPEVLRREETDVTYTYSPYSPDQFSSTDRSAKYWKVKAIETKDSDINRILGKIRQVEQQRFGQYSTARSPDMSDRHPYKTALDRNKQNPPPTMFKEMVYNRSRSPSSNNRIFDPRTAETNRHMINKYYPSAATTLPTAAPSARGYPDFQASSRQQRRGHPNH